jgi:UBX domain-containing protein 1
LEEEAQGGAVHVDLVDKKNEDFKEPPKPKVVAFSGHGQSLGGSSSAPLITTPAPAREIVVDASKPVTSIQIRTADGARLIGKFNHDHTILDIRSWLESQKKPTGPYDLITTLPARTLSDLNQTIKDAGLLNAAINQKNR